MNLKDTPHRIRDLAIWLGIGFVALIALLAFIFVTERVQEGAADENPAVSAVIDDASNHFSARAGSVEVSEVQAVTFNDSCLGAPEPDEVCAQVLTEGYRVTIEADGNRHVYHTDITGRSLRLVR